MNKEKQREIKFRAWDKENKRFKHYIVPSFSGNWEIDLCDKEKTLYTGLKDKNGKEIYEGDIVKFWDKEMKRVRSEEVYFENGAFWVNGREDRKDWEEVIGNIYENPELLKSANK